MALTLTDMVVKILKEQPGVKFTARQIAEKMWINFSDSLANKRNNPRFATDDDFILQLQAEVGSHKKSIKKRPNVIIEEQTRPKLYFFDQDYNPENDEEVNLPNEPERVDINEKELYPILGEYLKLEEEVYTKRIDELKSKNNRGPAGNKWLHPDIVGIKVLDNEWLSIIKDCVKGSGDNRILIYSFEVKKILTSSNLRESFFQAVSNSSWANYGYLVAAEIKGDNFNELKMLSSLHGIGFILLDISNPSESQILLQAKDREAVDWASVNRLAEQNADFSSFVESVKIYYESGIVRENDWY